VTGAVVALLLLESAALAGEAAESGAATAPAPAARLGITTLEQFLDRALRIHPEILAAEAKVASANAELSRARFQIARELIALWNGWRVQSADIETLESLASRGYVETRDLIEAKGELAEIEAQLSYLLGQASGPATLRSAAALPAGPKQAPAGPLVEKILEALKHPAELEFIETPIRDVADYLADFCGITFVVDPAVADVPMTASVRGIPLGAVVQAVEAGTPGIRFVVCDYGILVTSDTSEAAATYISANELWKETAGKAGRFDPRRLEMMRALQGRPPGSSPGKPFGFGGGGPGGGRKKPPSDARAPERGPLDDPFAPGPGPAQRDKPRSEASDPAMRALDPFAPAPRQNHDKPESQPGSSTRDAADDDPFAAPDPRKDN
jgi:hypothetical protein